MKDSQQQETLVCSNQTGSLPNPLRAWNAGLVALPSPKPHGTQPWPSLIDIDRIPDAPFPFKKRSTGATHLTSASDINGDMDRTNVCVCSAAVHIL